MVWIAVVFMMVALTAIGFTLFESWKFQGGAAAVNDLGSERMRTYRIAYLLAESLRDTANAQAVRGDLTREMKVFEDVLRAIKRGDPARPLFLPRNPDIVNELDALAVLWQSQIRPAVESVLADAHPQSQREQATVLRPRVEQFVQRIDWLVRAIEQDIAHDIAYLRYMQFGLIMLAIAGSVALIYLMFLLVVNPVNRLREGMQRMARGELGTRLPIESSDEIGDLATGFNRMASHLQDLYNTLEERVSQKTRSLAEKNRDLATLYEVTTLLNEPTSTETLCRGFLQKLTALLDAQGAAVRLIDPKTQDIHLYIHEGLAPDFVKDEQCLDMGECLCGEAAQNNTSIVQFLAPVQDANIVFRCQKAGYQTVSVFTIRFQRQMLGVFNLYHREQRTFSTQERQLLETLGQNLGVALENQRLVSRDRELAVTEERNLLAQELHDSIAQSLAFLNLQAQLLEDSLKRSVMDEARGILAQIREGIQESYDDVRELLVHFRTRIKQEDIELTIRSSLSRFESQTGVETSCEVSGRGVPLPPEQQLQVLHILQEALSNVRKHSGASRVEFEMKRGRDYEFHVRDNGCGFDPGALDDPTGSHIGLRIMKERAQRIGGEIRIESRPGNGSEITLILPVAQQQQEAAA
ncbi:MAG: type IV pili methyl-accepting chemotaxis transducer N-terminal domain-containing protein [Burkholderiales bacterium]|nr:type IV pili methyl-accepting chemotaxis transducer N-terminal domain-containing protein [Burkholderiales bacterium]